jgi:putative hydrolase of the HAD superfamily
MSSRSIESWVFDLDNTLYPAESTIYDTIGDRMTAYIARVIGRDLAAAEKERERLFFTHGATATGLQKEYGVDPADFIIYAHDTDVSVVPPDLELNALIAALTGRKFVFTNGGCDYAQRMISQLRLEGVFDKIIDIEACGLVPKPERAAYAYLIASCGIDPHRAILIEDTLRNLEPAAELGFETVLVGAVHPDPKPSYLHHTAHDLKSFLRTRVEIDRGLPAA